MSKDFILAVLLTAYVVQMEEAWESDALWCHGTNPGQTKSHVNSCEGPAVHWIFSGRARATLCMKAAGLRAARLDFMYFDGEGNNYYNILTDGGFAFLGKEILANPSKPNSATLFNMLYVHLAWVHGLTCHIRLCIATMLRARAGECVILLGMKCSSWTVVNQGTSRRAPCCPSGDTTKVSVKMANCMAARKLSFINLFFCCQSNWTKNDSNELWKPWAPMSRSFPRTILLCLLALATNNVYLLEQPFQSLLRWYGRFRHLQRVSRVSWLYIFWLDPDIVES